MLALVLPTKGPAPAAKAAAAAAPLLPLPNSYNMLVLTMGQVFFQPVQALTFQMVPLIFQMVCKKHHMTKLIARKKLRTHIISREQKLTFNLFFLLISRSCVLRDKNWQENKKISEHFAGQFASRTLKPYAKEDPAEKHQKAITLLVMSALAKQQISKLDQAII
jgi:hypothetical protein